LGADRSLGGADDSLGFATLSLPTSAAFPNARRHGR
jgi:hypothetical protein